MEEQKELVKNDVAIIQALKSSLYPGAKDESVAMVLSYCKAAGLDPMTKPVHLVPMNVKDSKTGKYDWRDVVMPGIELYRTKASRTKEHAGTTEPEFGPTIEKTFKGKDKDGKAVSVTVSFPEWCRVTARRLVGGKIVEFTAKEFWLENYATAGRDSEIPNAMWQKRPFGQLAKCSEAQALRKGFPEVGAQPTADEMAGKTIDAEGVVVDAGTERITEDQESELDSMIVENGFDDSYRVRLYEYLKVETLADIPAKDFAKAKMAITEAIKRRAAA